MNEQRNQQELLMLVTEAIRAAWDDGCPVAGHPEELAPFAVRRWQSAGRRIKGKADRESRIRDLTNGLIQAQEKDPDVVGRLKVDYRYLAEKIAEGIEQPTPPDLRSPAEQGGEG